MKNTWTLFLMLILLSGCGRVGYESRYTVDTLKPSSKKEIAQKYYDTVDKQLLISSGIVKDFSSAMIKIAEAIGQPLVPAEISPNTDITIQASDVERTKQIVALAYSMRRIAETVRVNVAAPNGFVNAPDLQPDLTLKIKDDRVDKYEDVKAIAKQQEEQLKRKPDK